MPYSYEEASGDVLVFLQKSAGHIHPISLELSAAAVDLAQKNGAFARGVLITDELTVVMEEEIVHSGLKDVFLYQNPIYSNFIAELFCAPLLACIETNKPGSLLVGATPEGRTLAPMAAVPLRTGVTADCTNLDFDENGLLIQTRPAFGGNVMARIITPKARPQIATVRIGIMKQDKLPRGKRKTRIVFCDTAYFLNTTSTKVKIAATVNGMKEEDKAGLIVVVGGGLKCKEDLAIFDSFCQQNGAILMCSRVLVERDWFSQSSQIGISGQSVSPKLLITFGVSGSVQFMAGIQRAEKICAVNTDANAPILKIADIPIVGDLYGIIKELHRDMVSDE